MSLKIKITPEVVLFSVLNLFGLGLSTYLVAKGALEITHEKPSCDYRNPQWVIGFGAYGVIMSLVGLGNILTSWKFKWLTTIYIAMMAGSIAVCIALLLFTFVTMFGVTSNNEGGFSWVARRYVQGEKWRKIEKCYEEQQVCKDILSKPAKKAESEVEASCCQGPQRCGYQLRNGTYWKTADEDDKDCQRWYKKAGDTCFDCTSCKRTYILDVTEKWMPYGLYWLAMFAATAAASGN